MMDDKNAAINDIHEKIKQQPQQQQIQSHPQIQSHEIRDPHGILELLMGSESRRSRL